MVRNGYSSPFRVIVEYVTSDLGALPATFNRFAAIAYLSCIGTLPHHYAGGGLFYGSAQPPPDEAGKTSLSCRDVTLAYQVAQKIL